MGISQSNRLLNNTVQKATVSRGSHMVTEEPQTRRRLSLSLDLLLVQPYQEIK
jgi:hypothetical protein